MTYAGQNEENPEAGDKTAPQEEQKYFCHLYDSLGRFAQTSRMRLGALESSKTDAGAELVPLFRRAGIRDIPLQPVADMHALVSAWLKDGSYDYSEMDAALADASELYRYIRPTILNAQDAQIVAQDFDNLPAPFWAMRHAIDMGDLMLDWDADGRLQDMEWCDAVAMAIEDHSNAGSQPAESARAARVCRTFPYMAVRPS